MTHDTAQNTTTAFYRYNCNGKILRDYINEEKEYSTREQTGLNDEQIWKAVLERVISEGALFCSLYNDPYGAELDVEFKTWLEAYRARQVLKAHQDEEALRVLSALPPPTIPTFSGSFTPPTTKTSQQTVNITLV